MKIGSKIYLGFGSVLVVLGVIAGAGIYSNLTNEASFAEYRESARKTNEAGRIQANMLEARLAFRKFRAEPTDELKQEVTTRLATTKASVDTMLTYELTDSARTTVSGFHAIIDTYAQDFDKVVMLQSQREELVDGTLDTLGPKMAGELETISESVATSGNVEAAATLERLKYDISSLRLGTNKFLLNNTDGAFENAKTFAEKAREEVAEIKASSTDAAVTGTLDTLATELATYETAIKSVYEVIKSRNEIINGSMNVAGDQLSTSVEQLKLDLKKTQDTLGPQIQSTMETAVMIGSTLAAVGLVMAGFIAFFIARSITVPVGQITSAMGSLADNKLDTVIPGLDHQSEIGLMAKAVDVFKQNAIKIRDLAAQEAALQEKNADLQSNIATVVDAAVAGDFTRRITKTYDNPDLDRFAANVNTLVQSVDTGIAETGRVISALAKGDLTESMEGHYQGVFADLQANVNETMSSLRTLMQEVRQSADAINGGADEIRQASNDLSRRTETQAASLEETSSALEEITVAVKTSTERAQDSSKMVTEARQFAEASSGVVGEATSAMSRIEQASNEITQIINVIDEIAFQTNLLALNAGVEAARAGEAGKGFAVVAQEVRELAQRSATAAKDIKTLITKSSHEVQTGVQLVSSTGQALSDIQAKVVGIASQVTSIATAAQEQSTGLSEVNMAVNQMDQMTQQNAAMVEEAAASTAKLAEETAHLRALVARFKVQRDGGAQRYAA
ncbi:methyl-accepting chemotaxis protein [Rhizobium rosettiformans]|uniref:methyl-accepting chemotaxis protein n=1 Tax=Rhizobium rosettiformans TaxID=1368430 RepID=UPI0028569D21|nr:methyl-accepting chemotaxis protein [Rhizobium rosettiformans]MDR7026702.1 methyl-accepting chemotaxis protein [Rhizobium rosettiformans]MDR7064823.1 methyl-accepting chemotaxis protein [Rhizobium rosettiformans]